jgi:hypothetical protein
VNRQYDIAQICLNGHVVNTHFISRPYNNKDFCPKCGEPSIYECSNCENPIDGYSLGNVIYTYEKPFYCKECGKPFPWTVKKINSINELIALEDSLNDIEKKIFKDSIDDISKNTETSEISANKIIILLKKISKQTGIVTRNLIVDIASEAIKKIILDR